MIYHFPAPEEPLDQGDLIDGCPVVAVTDYRPDQLDTAKVQLDLHRIIVLTQACDLANRKVDAVVTASVFKAEELVDQLEGDAAFDRLALFGDPDGAHASLTQLLQQLVRAYLAADCFSPGGSRSGVAAGWRWSGLQIGGGVAEQAARGVVGRE